MMKLTLNGVWKYCPAMWKWIAKKKRGSHTDISDLKTQWLRKNGFSVIPILNDCFFCDWAGGNCTKCPGRLVDPHFDCHNKKYLWYKHPIKFYREIARLNKLWRKNG